MACEIVRTAVPELLSRATRRKAAEARAVAGSRVVERFSPSCVTSVTKIRREGSEISTPTAASLGNRCEGCGISVVGAKRYGQVVLQGSHLQEFFVPGAAMLAIRLRAVHTWGAGRFWGRRWSRVGCEVLQRLDEGAARRVGFVGQRRRENLVRPPFEGRAGGGWMPRFRAGWYSSCARLCRRFENRAWLSGDSSVEARLDSAERGGCACAAMMTSGKGRGHDVGQGGGLSGARRAGSPARAPKASKWAVRARSGCGGPPDGMGPSGARGRRAGWAREGAAFPTQEAQGTR